MSSKSINTLVADIYSVIEGKGGWDEAVQQFFLTDIGGVLWARLSDSRTERGQPTLRLSAMGKPCTRQLWYDINAYTGSEVLPPSTRFKFLYGDILETLILSLAQAAGHTVEGMQDTLEVAGIRGHRDAVIDGITVDVKSASTYSYQKFKSGGLRADDPFGYVSQLSSYVYAGRDHPTVQSHPSLGAFLVVDKTLGNICLDMYDFGHEINTKEEDIKEITRVCNDKENVPPRGFEDVPDGKSGNMKLSVGCSYCSHKAQCWPELRTFLYSNGPKFLTQIEREPNVKEV